jgi:hypothetical protein
MARAVGVNRADRWGRPVSQSVGFYIFQKILNSVVSLKKHRKIIRCSKILNIFVYPLDDIFYLGKI